MDILDQFKSTIEGRKNYNLNDICRCLFRYSPGFIFTSQLKSRKRSASPSRARDFIAQNNCLWAGDIRCNNVWLFITWSDAPTMKHHKTVNNGNAIIKYIRGSLLSWISLKVKSSGARAQLKTCFCNSSW